MQYPTSAVLHRLAEADREERRRIIEDLAELQDVDPSVTDALVELVGSVYPEHAADSLRSTRESIISVIEVTEDECLASIRSAAGDH
jgi:hypothetical protein